jgi:MFS family permease
MGYRYSSKKIAKWEKLLVGILIGGVAFAFALAGGGLALHEALDVEEGSGTEKLLMGVVIVGLAVGALAVVGVIYIAAYMGGQSLHRRGGIIGVALATWLLGGWWPATQIGGALGHLLLWGVFAVLIAAFYVMGRKAKVPMWVQAPVPGSPRAYVTEGDTDVEGTRFEKRPERGDVSFGDQSSSPAQDRDDTP